MNCVLAAAAGCALFLMLTAVAWDFKAGAAGVHALEGPAGVELTSAMRALAGRDMPIRVAVIEVRADWPAPQ